MQGKVLNFGEVLLRMSPGTAGSWIKERQLPVFVGGAEANVATALAAWGLPSRYLTAMPDNYLGDDVAASLASRGIDVSSIYRGGNRIGIYYLQQGADLKHAGVIYDRFYSSFYELKPGMIDWDAALDGVSWFNFSAISPALNANVAEVCEEGLQAARARGCTISVDLNYRAKLWQWGRRPDEVMPALAQYCDVIMGNIWAAGTLLGIAVDEHAALHYDKAAFIEHASRTSEAVTRQFPRCHTVANTFRFNHGDDGLDYYTTLYHQGRLYVSPQFVTDSVVDKIGSGDCFMAGIIRGLYRELGPQETLDFATAAAFGKLNETGDATQQTAAQVTALLKKYGH